MPYTLKNYDGTTLTIVDDGTIDRQFSSSLYLLGKNVTGYGVYQNDNFLWLLQNFAGSIEPINKTQGQTWFDRSSGVLKLKVYDGTTWRSLTTLDRSVSTPTSSTVGDLWFKTNTSQLYVKDTTSTYALIGPQAIAGFGVSALVAKGVLDSSNVTRPALEFVIDGNILGVVTNDTFDIKSTEPEFATVSGLTATRGINLASSATITLRNISAGSTATSGTVTGKWTFLNSTTFGDVALTNLTAQQLTVSRGVAENFTATNLISVAGTFSNYLTAGTLQTRNITAGSPTTSGTLTGNWSLASGSTLFSTYADLAENYEADDTYAPGMVLEFGGISEVTLCTTDMSTKVAGIISTNPAYVMNAQHQLEGYVYSIALAGRIPCNVKGKIAKGDLLVAGNGGFARADKNPKIGSVIAKAMEDYDSTEIGQIEVMVWRG